MLALPPLPGSRGAQQHSSGAGPLAGGCRRGDGKGFGGRRPEALQPTRVLSSAVNSALRLMLVHSNHLNRGNAKQKQMFIYIK